MRRLTLDAVLTRINRTVAFYGSQAATARALHVSLSDLNRVVRGREAPGPALLAALGLRRVVTYEEVAP